MNWKTILVSLCVAVAGRAEDPFAAANQLFDAGQFAEAAAAYEQLLPKTAAIYFNLGNAYVRAGQLGRAVLNYERARRIAPRDPDVLANLKFTEEKLGVTELNRPARPVARWFWAIAEGRTLEQWSFLVIAGVWLTVGCVGAAILQPRWRSGFFLAAVVVGLALAVTVAALLQLVARERGAPTAVCVTPRTEARFAPLPDATVHFQLGEGTKVGIREDRGTWLHVERGDGQMGWVKAETVERVAARR
jgi:tetratricopeptide (TPR) repeat protein